MAYAINEKGTRTCHAKQWPSPPSPLGRVQRLCSVGRGTGLLSGDALLRQTQLYGTSWHGRNHTSQVRAAARSMAAIEVIERDLQ